MATRQIQILKSQNQNMKRDQKETELWKLFHSTAAWRIWVLVGVRRLRCHRSTLLTGIEPAGEHLAPWGKWACFSFFFWTNNVWFCFLLVFLGCFWPIATAQQVPFPFAFDIYFIKKQLELNWRFKCLSWIGVLVVSFLRDSAIYELW